MLIQKDWKCVHRKSLKGSEKPFPSFMLLLTTRASFHGTESPVQKGGRFCLELYSAGEEIKVPGRAGLGIRSQHKCVREPRPDSDVSFSRPVPFPPHWLGRIKCLMPPCEVQGRGGLHGPVPPLQGAMGLIPGQGTRILHVCPKKVGKKRKG